MKVKYFQEAVLVSREDNRIIARHDGIAVVGRRPDVAYWAYSDGTSSQSLRAEKAALSSDGRLPYVIQRNF